MLAKACKILRTMGCAEKLIRILTTLRITIFAGALIYAGVMFVSLLRQNTKTGA